MTWHLVLPTVALLCWSGGDGRWTQCILELCGLSGDDGVQTDMYHLSWVALRAGKLCGGGSGHMYRLDEGWGDNGGRELL